MNNLRFWNTWQKGEKNLYLVMLALFFISLLTYLVSYYIGINAVIHWTTEGSLQDKRVVIDTFNKFLFDFAADADSYSIMEEFVGSDIEINYLANYLYAGFFALGMVLLLSTATFLTRTWYFVVVAIIGLYLAKLNLELLGFAGLNGRFPLKVAERIPLVVALLAYLPLSYYFHAFNTRVSLFWRFVSFAAITAILALLTAQFATVHHPVLFINNFGIVVPVLLAVTFIGFNAHEIINGFLYLITHSANASSRNTPVHFIVLSGVYLLNVFYGYLVTSRALDWHILYIPPYALFPVTTLLGIWGFRKREKHYGEVVSFAPYGAFLYLAIAIISSAVIGYAFATDNDPLVEGFGNVILYTHLAFGLGFLLYVLSNFFTYIQENKQVHKIVYTPYKVEFMWVGILGGVLIALFIFRSNYFLYNQSLAGYYNGIGDIYMAEDDKFLSEQYYKTALGFEHQNHKSNYSLGSLARVQGDEAMAYFFFEQSQLKRPSEYSYVNMGKLLLKNNKFFEALFKLREGIERFPKSGQLYNNLAMTFNRTAVADSALFYLEIARQKLPEPDVAEANLYAFYAKYPVTQLDSIHAIIDAKSDYVGMANNQLVVENFFRQRSTSPLKPEFLKDSILQTVNMCYLYNYALNQLGTGDTAVVADLRRFASIEANYDFTPFLDLAQALKLRDGRNYLQAVRMLKNLHYHTDPVNSYYAHLLGLWLLEMDEYRRAADYFEIAYTRGLASARINQAIALSELPDKTAALEIWTELAAGQDEGMKEAALDALRFIHPDSVKRLDIDKLDDEERYRLAHYNPSRLTNDNFNTLLGKISNANYKWLAVVERIRYYLDRGDVAIAEQLRNSITGVSAPVSAVEQELRLTDLHLLYRLRQFDKMKNVLDGAQFQRTNAGYQTFYSAVVASESGDVANAERLFRTALLQLPYKTSVPIAFAQFYNRQKQQEKAYNMLVEALYVYEDYKNYPSDLFEMYILQCLELQYMSYAEDGVNKLKEVASPEEYARFRVIYDKRMAEIEQQAVQWQ